MMRWLISLLGTTATFAFSTVPESQEQVDRIARRWTQEIFVTPGVNGCLHEADAKTILLRMFPDLSLTETMLRCRVEAGGSSNKQQGSAQSPGSVTDVWEDDSHGEASIWLSVFTYVTRAGGQSDTYDNFFLERGEDPDLDGNGCLSVDEVESMIDEAYAATFLNSATRLARSIDQDKDSCLSRAEVSDFDQILEAYCSPMTPAVGAADDNSSWESPECAGRGLDYEMLANRLNVASINVVNASLEKYQRTALRLDDADRPDAALLITVMAAAGASLCLACAACVGFALWLRFKRKPSLSSAHDAILRASFDSTMMCNSQMVLQDEADGRLVSILKCPLSEKVDFLQRVHPADAERLRETLAMLEPGHNVAQQIEVQIRTGAQERFTDRVVLEDEYIHILLRLSLESADSLLVALQLLTENEPPPCLVPPPALDVLGGVPRKSGAPESYGRDPDTTQSPRSNVLNGSDVITDPESLAETFHSVEAHSHWGGLVTGRFSDRMLAQIGQMIAEHPLSSGPSSPKGMSL
eukprot:gb/GFBE01008599.1/.p1 GENE.gb/GFBE01008599.1/~~gb/GFBE01008599.1/.p1  ORF type:complete len:526 (+),score=82.36 gb/GFBE01008599.1/:1-1578(+)